MRRRNYSRPYTPTGKPWFGSDAEQSRVRLRQWIKERMEASVPLMLAESQADADRIQKIADDCGIRVRIVVGGQQ